MNDRKDPIGVFDSGVGGISSLASMTRLLPGERFIYYGDTANAPYGTKTTGEVIACVRNVVAALMKENIKAIVIACNTATGAAAGVLRQECGIPVIGMEPALKPASEARKNGRILVMATPLALRQEKFTHLMSLYGEGAERVPCEGLMEFVENEDFSGAQRYLHGLFARSGTDDVDAVVLGCTHYVFLKDMIRDMLPEHILVTDGNEGTARQLKRVLAERDLLNDAEKGSVAFRTSGDPEHVLAVMERLYQRAVMG